MAFTLSAAAAVAAPAKVGELERTAIGSMLVISMYLPIFQMAGAVG